MSNLSRRDALKMLSGAVWATTLSHGKGLGQTNPSTLTPGLTPGVMRLLPLGAIKPAGWLARQLRIQANGMSGHLDEFWPDVGPNSGWLGGTGESWERGPYFLDGLVPLAYLARRPGAQGEGPEVRELDIWSIRARME